MSSSIIGGMYKNNKGLEFEVLRKSDKPYNNGTYKYLIRFIDSGYESLVYKSNILSGGVKDRLSPSMFGVGYLGDTRYKGNEQEFIIWKSMLERCYSEKYIRFHLYGGAGVKVCERWKSFEKFSTDLPLIEGYDRDLFKQGKIHLDKDKKQEDVPASEKIYSLSTCEFVTPGENGRMRDMGKFETKFVATSPEGEKIQSSGLRKFERDTGLNREYVKRCLRGEIDSYKGWKFSNKEGE